MRKSTSPNYHDPVASAIRGAIATAGMTQTEVSEVTGIHRGNLSFYCTGKNKPSIEHAIRIADALGVTLDALLRHK